MQPPDGIQLAGDGTFIRWMFMNTEAASSRVPVRTGKRRRRILAGLFVIAQIALWTGVMVWEPPEADGPLKVAVGLWPGSETLTIARERGILDDDEVRVIEMTWSSAAMRAFGNRVVDAAVLTLDETLRLREYGHDARIVLPMDISAGADALVTLGRVDDVRSLRGRRVGVELRTAGMYLLAQALNREGMTVADLDVIPLNLAETESSLIEGEVDAVVTSEPWLSRLRDAGATTLFDSRQTPDQLCRVLVVRGEVLERREQEVSRLISTHLRILGEMTHGLTAAEVETITRREGLSRASFDLALREMKHPGGKEALQLMEAEGASGLNGIADQVVSFMKAKGLLTSTPERREWLAPAILRRVVK